MTSVTVVNLPCNIVRGKDKSLDDGLGRRRVMIFIRGTTTKTTNTERLTTWVPDLADVEGITMGTLDDTSAATATPITWSTTTLNYANHSGNGNQEFCVFGRLT